MIQIVAKSGMTHHADARARRIPGGRSATIPSMLQDARWRLLQPAWTEAACRARRGGGARAMARRKHSAPCWRCTMPASRSSPASIRRSRRSASALHVRTAGLTWGRASRRSRRSRPQRSTPARSSALHQTSARSRSGKLADLVIVDGNPLARHRRHAAGAAGHQERRGLHTRAARW